jgi:hypothetical protein
MAADGRRSGTNRPAAALLLATSALALVGCSAEQAPPPPPTPRASLPAAPTSAPPVSAGPLDSATLPEPDALGPGWEYRVEGADPEDGAGNGSPFQQRDPDEIVVATIPMGCEARSPSPVPENVLQATYAHPGSGSYAVALRMRFGSPEAADEFAAVRAADLATCRDQPDDPYSGAPAPVLESSIEGSRTTTTYRLVGEPDTWYGLALVAGRDVLTIDTDADPTGLVDWFGAGMPLP